MNYYIFDVVINHLKVTRSYPAISSPILIMIKTTASSQPFQTPTIPFSNDMALNYPARFIFSLPNLENANLAVLLCTADQRILAQSQIPLKCLPTKSPKMISFPLKSVVNPSEDAAIISILATLSSLPPHTTSSNFSGHYQTTQQPSIYNSPNSQFQSQAYQELTSSYSGQYPRYQQYNAYNTQPSSHQYVNSTPQPSFYSSPPQHPSYTYRSFQPRPPQ